MNNPVSLLFELQTLEFGDRLPAAAQERIAALRAEITPTLLTHYDRLADTGKRGVAVVRNHACSGCHIRVPLGTILELKRAETILLCESCRRYLYLPPGADAGIAELAPKKTPVRRNLTKVKPIAPAAV